MTVWRELESFMPDDLGDGSRDHHAWWVFYNDSTIRIAPAAERIPAGYVEHYGIAGMRPAGFIIVQRRDTREAIAGMATQKAEMYRKVDVGHEAWRSARVAAGTWNPTVQSNVRAA